MSGPGKPEGDDDKTLRDFAVLIRKLKQEFADAAMHSVKSEWLIKGVESAAEELAPLGWDEGQAGFSHIVTLDRTAVELGPPSMPSLDILMTTNLTGLVDDGRVTLLGRDLPVLARDGDAKSGFVQALLLALSSDADPDRFALEKKRYLINRIPGYMVRSVPGRLWARIDHGLMEKGFSFYHLGCALYRAFQGEVEGVVSCELLFVAGEDTVVSALEDISKQARLLSRENKKLQLDPDGTYSCTELDCESCDEKPYCDEIRDLIKFRKRTKSP